nr:ankyrin repeat-containing domain, PGG domain protein [Tanacetum cinerariifolium]
MIPPSYRDRKNKDGLTAYELFTMEHKDLVTLGESWMKETANQCMVVAALIATIVFAAAFTVPGGYDQDKGLPLFRSKAVFMVFVVADAISLLSSSASILMFLSILTSRYAERDFLESLPKKLMGGLATLFLSITTMTITFGVSFFILYHKGLLWTPILIGVLAVMPVLLYIKLQIGLFVDIIRSTYGSSQEDVWKLSAHVVKLRDMPEGVLVLSSLSWVQKSQIRDSILRDSSGNAPSHVAKRTRSTTTQSSGVTSRPNLFVGNDDDEESDDDEDACVEITLITPIRSAATIPVGENQGRGSNHSVSKGPSHRDGIVASSYEVSREEWDGPHQPTLTILTKEIFIDPSVCKTVVDQFLILGEMVRIEALTGDQLARKMSAKAKGKDRQKKIKSLSKSLDQLTSEVSRHSSNLNQSWNVVALKDAEFLTSDEFSRVQGEVFSLAANPGFERGLHMDQTHEQFDAELKKISHFVPGVQSRLIEATPLVFATDYPFPNKVAAHSTQPLFDIVELKLDRLARPVVVPTPRAIGVSPPVPKETTATPAPSSLKLFSSDAPPSSAAALEQNKQWLNAMVDKTDEGVVDAAFEKHRDIFMQGMAHPVNDDASQAKPSLIRGSEIASSGPGDVVVALSSR